MCHRFLNLICIDGIAAMCKNTEPGIHLPARTLAAGMIGGFYRYIRSIPRKTRICKNKTIILVGQFYVLSEAAGTQRKVYWEFLSWLTERGKGNAISGDKSHQTILHSLEALYDV